MTQSFDPTTTIDLMVTHGPLGLRIRRFKAGPKGMELDGYLTVSLENRPALKAELEKLIQEMDEQR